MKARTRRKRLELTLDLEEALALQNLLGSLVGQPRRTMFGWYGDICEALEGRGGLLPPGTQVFEAVDAAKAVGKLPDLTPLQLACQEIPKLPR